MDVSSVSGCKYSGQAVLNNKNNPNFTSNFGTKAYQIEKELTRKGIFCEFRDNSFVAECTQKTVNLFENLFKSSWLPGRVNFTEINPKYAGECTMSGKVIRINSSLDYYDSKETLVKKMKEAKHIFFLPDDFSTIHYLSAFIHEFAHSAHFNHLRENNLGYMIPTLGETKIPNAIGRLITKFKLGNYSAQDMDEFMAERITKDIAKNLNANDEYIGSKSDVQYSDIFMRKWNCRYISPQAYIDYFTQQVWDGDIESAEEIAKEIDEYMDKYETAKDPAKLKAPSFETKLKTIERPKEETKVKQKSFLGKIDAFLGKNLPTINFFESINDIKTKIKL